MRRYTAELITTVMAIHVFHHVRNALHFICSHIADAANALLQRLGVSKANRTSIFAKSRGSLQKRRLPEGGSPFGILSLQITQN